ncbi:MAG: VOC family protein [Acidobacteria bacterium]|jgi:catechol 2,3-dioxygenase-like lactoylglutathione lyase family enzyme|nr:VOC family protein [Acidobacteriota bacterium]
MTPAGVTFGHVNIVARDWKRLSRFYQAVFGCEPVPPRRQLSGAWLEAGTGVPGAALEGEHLRLPGHGPDGPTLEIYSYSRALDRPGTAANRLGLGHLAFRVPHVEEALEQVHAEGGRALGEVASARVPGRGQLTFVYACDPESNIIELQSWSD